MSRARVGSVPRGKASDYFDTIEPDMPSPEPKERTHPTKNAQLIRRRDNFSLRQATGNRLSKIGPRQTPGDIEELLMDIHKENLSGGAFLGSLATGQCPEVKLRSTLKTSSVRACLSDRFEDCPVLNRYSSKNIDYFIETDLSDQQRILMNKRLEKSVKMVAILHDEFTDLKRVHSLYINTLMLISGFCLAHSISQLITETSYTIGIGMALNILAFVIPITLVIILSIVLDKSVSIENRSRIRTTE